MLDKLLPEKLYKKILAAVPINSLTEIRLRKGLPVAVKDSVRRYLFDFPVTFEVLENIVLKASDFSIYAHQQEIAAGFLYYKGGIRIGVTGRGVTDGISLKTFKDFTSVNIRIPHEIIGAAAPLNEIFADFKNTLIISPPFAGKTTLIRDAARILSENYDVCIIDERSEIAGEGYTLGRLSDVVSGVPKLIAYEGIIRSLSPEIIVLDEIFPRKDLSAVEDISRSGIKLIGSIHGEGQKDVPDTLLSYFDYAVTLGYKPRVGSIKSIERLKL